jgi:hypothetical protein
MSQTTICRFFLDPQLDPIYLASIETQTSLSKTILKKTILLQHHSNDRSKDRRFPVDPTISDEQLNYKIQQIKTALLFDLVHQSIIQIDAEFFAAIAEWANQAFDPNNYKNNPT